MLQGSNIAGDVYNLVQAKALNCSMVQVSNQEIQPGEEGYVQQHIEEYDDVYNIYGDPETCLQLDEYYDREMEKIGVYQNLNKRCVFGYGEYSRNILDFIQQKHYKLATDGIIVVGSPLGTFDYEQLCC